MMFSYNLVICVCIYIAILFISFTNSHVNVYMSREESHRLLGLNTELYYIRDGKINDYALKFMIPVPTHISQLHFTWQSLKPTPQMPYSIAFSVSDQNALEIPAINITRKGTVPLKPHVFRILLQCTGKQNAEVEVQIFINITMSASANVTSLNIKRKKICLKEEVKSAQPIEEVDDHDKEEKEETIPTDATAIAATNPLYIAVGCASAMILLMSLLAMMCYVRSQKERQTASVNYGGSSSHLSASKPGHAFLRVDTPNNITLSKNGSQYSSFRRLMTTTPSSLYRTISVPIHIMNSDHRASQLSEQITELAVERRKIILQEKLHEGTFAQIYRGVYLENESDRSNEQRVMIKTVSDQASKLQISLVVAEGMMMWSFKHRNILSVIATCTDDPKRPLLMYPLMNQGNLKLFLQKCKFSSEGHVQTLLTQDLVQIAIQIAYGMIYLHKKKLIHRDLATRNCVVNANDDGSFLVKITDNALSRDLFPNDYHCLGDNENRPVKWLAIESLIHKEFTFSSDVWSYGVTLWELMTLGQQPYFEVDPFEIGAYLRDNYRLFQPINCPDKLYDIMLCCWNESTDGRPTFPQLLSCLQDFYTALGKYI